MTENRGSQKPHVACSQIPFEHQTSIGCASTEAELQRGKTPSTDSMEAIGLLLRNAGFPVFDPTAMPMECLTSEQIQDLKRQDSTLLYPHRSVKHPFAWVVNVWVGCGAMSRRIVSETGYSMGTNAMPA